MNNAFGLHGEITYKTLRTEAITILERNDCRKATIFLNECNALANTPELNTALAFACTATLSYENDAAWAILSNMRIEALTELIKFGNCTGYNILHCAVNAQKMKHVELILQRFESDSDEIVNTPPKAPSGEPSFGQLPLFLSIRKRDKAIAILLVEHGADLSRTDSDGNTALHVAILEAKEDCQEAQTFFDVLLSVIPIWMQKWLTYEDENLLTLKHKQQAAAMILTRTVNSDGFTPLTLAVKLGCTNIVSKLLDLEGVYRFTSQHGRTTNKTLYDMREIDSLCTQDKRGCSILELLITEYNSENLACLKIPAIRSVVELKRRYYVPFLASLGIFHVIFVIFFNVIAYMHLLPRTMQSFNASVKSFKLKGNSMFEFTIIDFLVLIISLSYILQALVIACAVWYLTQKNKLSLIDKIYMCNCLDTVPSLIFAISCGLYLILKQVSSDLYVYFLATALLAGWVKALMFMKIIRKLAFFSIMYTSVLSGEIFSFLFIILGLVVAFSIAACCIFYHEAETQCEGNSQYLLFGNVMLAYTQLAVGISDFAFLSESSNWFNYVLYIMFLIGANVVLFNVLLAAISNVYSNISKRADLLCEQVLIRDIIILESVIPLPLKMSVKLVYRFKQIRISCKHRGQRPKVSQTIDLCLHEE